MQTGSARPQSAEMTPGPGYRFRRNARRPSPEVVHRFGAFGAADVSDMMNRLYTMNPSIKPVTPRELRLLGPACTVKVFPGDNLMVHKSLDLANPGDVLVIDASSSMMTAVIGDLVSTKARHRGIAGVVVDGLVRDLDGILALGDFPVFARGTTPLGPLHRGPGEVNYPVSVGGIVVNPGDVIVGDADGVVVVPQESADSMLQRLDTRAAGAAEYQSAVARGEFSNAWVDSMLAASGLESEPDLD
ncbi:methyltransferase [Geodermatophilus sabuli]|uniref:Putative 4-hydroxy-4-methyl-2-oxoglutarate aldolase n=1 Tax=Geodermatophilus sabuli TaxID=1564158 RepID=A0A285EJW3_9ACTN|nr:methyltransferase [Geodermatophilus sabuli]MBB3087071.1 RraA family protein [Geodermatophilus sabuli]SNX99408.1 RraA famliy [Geodermatophilus sabuli]